MNQRGLAAACASYDADGLSPLYLHGNIVKGFRPGSRISQMHMIELHSQILSVHACICSVQACRFPCIRSVQACCFLCVQAARLRPAVGRKRLPLHGRLHFKDGFDAVGAGKGLGNGDNQICQFNELHKDLGHIIDKGHHLALGNHGFIYPNRPGVKQYHSGRVDNNICDRIGQSRYPAH